MAVRYQRDKLYLFRGAVFQTSLSYGRAPATVPYEKVVIGRFAGTHATRADCVGEFAPDGRIYRIEEGHLPPYQPRVTADQLEAAMLAGPYPIAYPVTP